MVTGVVLEIHILKLSSYMSFLIMLPLLIVAMSIIDRIGKNCSKEHSATSHSTNFRNTSVDYVTFHAIRITSMGERSEGVCVCECMCVCMCVCVCVCV